MKLTLERIDTLRRRLAERWAIPESLDPAELLALLDSARALARLEAWLRAHRGCRAQTYALVRTDAVSFRLDVAANEAHRGPDLAAAIHAAPDGAEVRE